MAGTATLPLPGTLVTGNSKSPCCLSPLTRNVCCQGRGKEHPVHLPLNTTGALGTWAHSLLPVLALGPQGNYCSKSEIPAVISQSQERRQKGGSKEMDITPKPSLLDPVTSGF